MKHIALVAVMALTACGSTHHTITELGPNRFRVTAERMQSIGDAEQVVAYFGRAHCTERGQAVDFAGVTSGTTSGGGAIVSGVIVPIRHGSASAEFRCVPAQTPRA